MSRTCLKFALMAVVGMIATDSANAGLALRIGGRRIGPAPFKQPVINDPAPVAGQAFHYGRGAFIRQGAGWIEYQNGRPAFYFHEVQRSANFVDLFDATRQATVRIEPGRALILLPGRPWQFLYSGQYR